MLRLRLLRPLCAGDSKANLTEAARAAGIGASTLLRWMKEPEFDKGYRKARRQAFGQGMARLQQASAAAVSSILKVMLDKHGPVTESTVPLVPEKWPHIPPETVAHFLAETVAQ